MALGPIAVARRREALSRDVRLALIGPRSSDSLITDFEERLRALMASMGIAMDAKEGEQWQ